MSGTTGDEHKKLNTWLESIIFRYFHIWSPVNCQELIKRYEIYELCLRARELFWSQPLYRHVEVPVTIVGDIHGQFEDLKMMMDMNGWPFSEDEAKEMCRNMLTKNGKDMKVTLPATLGSGTDRQKGPKNYLFLGDYVDRGSHSIEVVLMLFAMHLRWPDRVTLLRGNHESRPVNRAYGFYGECSRRYSDKIYEVFQLAFNTMPLTAIVNKRIMCMHGGISEELYDLKQEGYEFFADRRLVTIFSAPFYCGQTNNVASMLNIDSDMVASFMLVRPVSEINREMNVGEKAEEE
ncbi:hypothetical protein GCK72_000224 [Caenorhabditis remanei]|uniref:Serine/threonine-protein phosphatase n=3 Tax=Caenorhabditis TaxID=6237 RepID=A0A6A5HRP6_CAERE|nr:hypothetical protein GCK72_000224 [Caenorhabditis remanei]KAF1768412.1 hypothetical protein GCK72_000224 [Caenorhabditis remanei]